jgi:hypothetical protein
MANWEQFHAFIKSNYIVQDDSGNVLTLVFEVNGGRSQIIVLERQSFKSSDSDWVTVSSPVGKVANINLTLALRKANGYVVGGLTIEDDFLLVRHSAPLANLDANEIVEPMLTLARVADQLEAGLVGGDEF